MVTRLRTARIAFGLALALAMTKGPEASAQASKPRVELLGERGSLDALEAAKLEELVGLELAADAPRVSRVVIEVRAGRASVEVMVGAERRRASVTLAGAEPERALALLVAELARGDTTSAAPPPPSTPPSTSPPATPAPSPASSPAPPSSALPTASQPAPSVLPPRASAVRPWRFSLLGTLGARVMTADGALVTTPRLEIGARQTEGLRVGATARYGYASADDPLGTVRAHAFAGGLAATYVLASSAFLALATGPRVEVGIVAGRGDGENGTSATALTLGGAWELELQVRLGGVTLLGAVEAGTLVRGIELRADDRDVLHLWGPFAGLALGAML